MVNTITTFIGILGLSLVLLGCSRSTPSAAESPAGKIEPLIGPHGGLIAEVGAKHHAEILCNDDGELQVYFLCEDCRTPAPLQTESITGFASPVSSSPIPERLILTPASTKENESHFVTMIPDRYRGEKIAVVFPKVIIEANRKHFDFEMTVPPMREDNKTASSETSPSIVLPSESPNEKE